MSSLFNASGSRALLLRFSSLGVLLILGALVYFSAGRSAGQIQLDRTAAALKNVHSWRKRSEVRQGGRLAQTEIDESSCPSNIRHTVIIEGDDTRAKLQLETVRLGPQSFERVNDQPWRAGGMSNTRTCLDGSSLLDFGIVPIKIMRDFGQITKGDKRLVDGAKCRDWHFIAHLNGAPPEQYTVCIDPDSDLPREIRSADGQLVTNITDLNAPINISAPELPPAPANPSSTFESSTSGTQ